MNIKNADFDEALGYAHEILVKASKERSEQLDYWKGKPIPVSYLGMEFVLMDVCCAAGHLVEILRKYQEREMNKAKKQENANE